MRVPSTAGARPSRALIAVGLALAGIGCGDDAAPGGGARDAGTDARPSPADIPWLATGVPPIAISPCPTGWREIAGDVATCDPYPEGGPVACAGGEAHFPGEPGCRPIGEPCPAGDFAASLPTDSPVVYVRAGAPAGGDGSHDAPYATLGAVRWSVLPAGTTVALAKGTYDGNVALRGGVSLVGACVAETVVRGTVGVPGTVIVASGGEPATVRNLAIADAWERGVIVDTGRGLRLQGVLVEGWHEMGLVVAEAGTTAELSDVVFSRSAPAGSQTGRGIDVELGAELRGERVLLLETHEAGLFASDPGTLVVLADTVIADTQRYSDGSRGIGVEVARGARLEGTRLLLERNHEVGVHVGLAGTEVVLTQTVVRESLPRADGRYGRAISVEMGAHLEASQLLLERNHDCGIRCELGGTTCVVSDAVVRDTRSRELGMDYGRGLAAIGGARLEATRVLLAGNRSSGAVAMQPDSELVLTDVAVRDTASEEGSGYYGNGLLARYGARIAGDRVLVESAHEMGLGAADESAVDLRGVAVRRITPAECGCAERDFAHGVAVLSATVRLAGFEVRDATTCGLYVARDASGAEPSLDVEAGLVTHAQVGACLAVDGYDLARLSAGVLYEDNDRALDTTTLPVPDLPGIGER